MHPIYTYIKQSLSGLYSEPESTAIAKAILTDVFHLSTIDLYAGKDIIFSKNDYERLADILNRLKRHEPLQYIIGEVNFFGLSLHVAPGILIPRPETSELIEWILNDHQQQSNLHVLDIGTGSGCIAIALAKHLPKCHVEAWDISPKSIEITNENSKKNNVLIRALQRDILQDQDFDIKVDILVSNPPYIAEEEREDMDRNVLEWEPSTALFVPDNNPLIFYKRIAEIGNRILNENGCLYFEINQRYGEETFLLLQNMGYQEIELRKDISGNDRMIKARRK